VTGAPPVPAPVPGIPSSGSGAGALVPSRPPITPLLPPPLLVGVGELLWRCEGVLLEPPDEGLLPPEPVADELPLLVLPLCREVGLCDGAAVVGAAEGEVETDGADDGDCAPPLG